MNQELKEEINKLYGKNKELEEITEELKKKFDDTLQRVEKQIHNIEGFPEEYLHDVEKITHRWTDPNGWQEKCRNMPKFEKVEFGRLSDGRSIGLVPGMIKRTKETERQNVELMKEKEMLEEQYQNRKNAYENECEKYVGFRGLLTVLTFLAIEEKKYDELGEDIRNLIEFYLGRLDEIGLV